MKSAFPAVATVAFALLAPTTVAADEQYPNELPGYQFHASAKWGAVRPLVSTQPEVDALLGPPNPVYRDAARGWKYIVFYGGEGGSCDGRPFPSSLIGKVSHIELYPKTRVSFSGVQFPAAFRKHFALPDHDPVGSWLVYKDDFGLEYQVYEKASQDGSIRAGDLRAIVYGPSRQEYERLTGCPEGLGE